TAQLRILAALDRRREVLEHHALDVRARDGDDVVLGGDEDVERVGPGVDAALQAARGPREDVLPAPPVQLELGLAIAQVARVVAAGTDLVADPGEELADRAALGDRLDDLAADERRGAERVELAELVAEVG